MNPRPQPLINYLYFGVYFALLLLMSASSVFVKENLSGSRIFFFLYAAGQGGLETLLLIFLGCIIRKYLGEKPFYFFIGATFLLFIFHLIDFFMDRVLDLSVWQTLGFVLDENLTNFYLLLDASGVSLWIWIVGFSILALLPLVAIFLYRLSEKAIASRPFLFEPERFFMAFFCLPAALLFWDFSAYRVVPPDAYTHFIQSLPWKFTFLEPKSVSLPLSNPLKSPLTEKEIQSKIAKSSVSLQKKPNIYLFIVESLRRDAISEKTTPNLHKFGTNYTPSDLTISNANSTAISWFSIFHSQFSYCWSHLKKMNWEMGSPPLSLLKKWGYKIRVYTSANLGYYGMEELLFGKKTHLLDSYKTFHHSPPQNAADADAKALAELQEDLEKDSSLQEGQIFIVFWDATHFDYSWPKSWTPQFVPFSSELAYFKAFYSNQRIELIKNRYRNSVAYVDFLFGKFLEKLPHSDDAIVFFMGDHGEEFFEHGHLFHNSHLVEEQTHIPLFMKFGSKRLEIRHRLATQMDIFPSLIDYLSGNVPTFLEGHSIFQTAKWPFVVSSRFNASRSPYEFCIHNGTHKLIARFNNKKNIFKSNALQIRSIRTAADKPLFLSDKKIDAWVEAEFSPAINHLFPKNSD